MRQVIRLEQVPIISEPFGTLSERAAAGHVLRPIPHRIKLRYDKIVVDQLFHGLVMARRDKFPFSGAKWASIRGSARSKARQREEKRKRWRALDSLSRELSEHRRAVAKLSDYGRAANLLSFLGIVTIATILYYTLFYSMPGVTQIDAKLINITDEIKVLVNDIKQDITKVTDMLKISPGQPIVTSEPVVTLNHLGKLAVRAFSFGLFLLLSGYTLQIFCLSRENHESSRTYFDKGVKKISYRKLDSIITRVMQLSSKITCKQVSNIFKISGGATLFGTLFGSLLSIDNLIKIDGWPKQPEAAIEMELNAQYVLDRIDSQIQYSEIDCIDRPKLGPLQIRTFASGKDTLEKGSNPQDVKGWVGNILDVLKTRAQGRELHGLIFIGSADKRKYSGTNAVLAQQRAKAVETEFKRKYDELQHENNLNYPRPRLWLSLNPELPHVRLVVDGKKFDAVRAVQVCAIWPKKVGQ
ncbi:MAG: hypothetical protein AB7U61_12080 [Methylocystis sp.]